LNENYNSLSEETYTRFIIFKKNLEILRKHNNNPDKLYEMKISQFTDMTKEEVASKLLNFNMKNIPELQFLNDIHNHKKDFYAERPIDEVVNWSDIDWRDKDILNDVRNQGDCGGCWAFSVVGTVEAMRNIKYGRRPYLSVQQLIDCDSLDKGCKGGWAANALKYIARNGVVKDDDYPYEEKTSTCKGETITPDNIETKIDSRYLSCEEDECNQGEYQFNLLKNGPVSVVIDAYNTNFYNYSSGYYNESCAEPNHAVILVGFGIDSAKGVKYWIIRNSWGSSWGMNGYGYVKYDPNNYWSCNLGRYGFQPKIIN
jgi:C1A family cysteine protease